MTMSILYESKKKMNSDKIHASVFLHDSYIDWRLNFIQMMCELYILDKKYMEVQVKHAYKPT